VVVGIYEASLQRQHDIAEVWPHVEISTWVDSAATLRLDNTGLGPALVEYVDLRVDGKSQRSWEEALRAMYGREPPPFSHATTLGHALRPGDRSVLVSLPVRTVPGDFWAWAGRITLQVCYSSVFHSHWTVTDTLGKSDHWAESSRCAAPAPHADL
jgi:hypothetical protein